jgi:mono/diheme cytochrome c family protein
LAATWAGSGIALAGAPRAASQGSLFTAAQADRGQENYEHYCRACHGDHLDDGDMGGPPLDGAYFRTRWGPTNLAALFAFTKGAMPPDDPGGLDDETYADILAYILRYNGYRPGANGFPTDPGAQAKLKLASPGG